VRGINSQIPLHSVLYYTYYVTALLGMRIVGVNFDKNGFFAKQGTFCMNSPQRVDGECSWRAGFFWADETRPGVLLRAQRVDLGKDL
jgi:hypothetical protein